MCLPVAGPLARRIEDVELFMSSYLGLQPWRRDPSILEIPWRKEVVNHIAEKKQLKIAYFVDDGVVRPQPPVERAVKETIERLQRAGHEVVQWNAQSHAEAYDLWLRSVLADGGERCKRLCQIADEPLIEGMLVGKPGNLLDNDQRQALADEVWEFQRQYMKRWNDSEIDALIMPVTQWVGLRPKEWVKADMYVGYTSIWNLLNWTALAVPACVASKTLDVGDAGWSAHQARSFSDQVNHTSYDIDLIDGMPVGIQIVTGRFGEEKAIGLAKVLNSLPPLR